MNIVTMTTIKVGGRGRPRKLDSETGIEIARQWFLRYGFELLSISDLCQALNIAPTSLYSTYGNKEQLFQRVLEHYCTSFSEKIALAGKSSSDPSEFFRCVLEASRDFYQIDNQKLGCLLLQGGLHCKHSDVSQRISELQFQLRQRLADRLSQLGSNNANELAGVLLTLLHGLAACIRSGASDDEIFTTTEFFCSAFDG